MNKRQALIYNTLKHRSVAEPLPSLAKAHNKEIKEYAINYYGSNYYNTNNLINSLNKYLAQDLPVINQNLIPSNENRINYSGETIPKLEFIIVHDTEGGAATDTALAMSTWCVDPTNGASWHYTVGNDGIYQQLPNNIIGWHAGDGSKPITLNDTGIPYTKDRPNITLGDDGYYYIEGVKSNVTYPSEATPTTPICSLGIVCVKLENGNYGIPPTYINSTHNVLCSKGGGSSIGIETCVNNGSDIFLTWHLTAKLVAKLLVENNLAPDRVWFHNNFSGKTCPKTMINNSLVEMFLAMVNVEYAVANSKVSVNFTDANGSTITGRMTTLATSGSKINYVVNGKLKLNSTVT